MSCVVLRQEDAVGVIGKGPSSENKESTSAAEPAAADLPASSPPGNESPATSDAGTSSLPKPARSGLLDSDPSQWHTARKGEDLVYPRDVASQAAPPFPQDALREHFPECPAECLEDWVGDGWCDSECNVAECGYDGPDCEGWCGGECRPDWPGDGQCDVECYKEECGWDGGDCKDWKDRNLPSAHDLQKKVEEAAGSEDPDAAVEALLAKDLQLSACDCLKGKLGNGVCNPECNTYECQFDGFDCKQMCDIECPHVWLGDGKCDKECDVPACFNDKGDCDSCSEGCRTWMVGNGVCDPACNNKDCGYDNGDCNGITAVIAVDYDAKPYVYQFCAKEFIGDGNCDENCYNEESEWDGGDCRGTPLAKRLAAEGVGPNFPKKDKPAPEEPAKKEEDSQKEQEEAPRRDRRLKGSSA